jgi:gas vesicle protein
MKTASKVFFGLGVVATIGAATLIYVMRKERAKSAEGLLDEGKDLLRDTKDAIEDGFESTMHNETNEEKTKRHIVKNIQRTAKDVGDTVKKGIDEMTDDIQSVATKITKKIKNDA